MRANASPYPFAVADNQCLEKRLFDDSAESSLNFSRAHNSSGGGDRAGFDVFEWERRRQQYADPKWGPERRCVLVLFSKLINPVKLGVLIQLLLFIPAAAAPTNKANCFCSQIIGQPRERFVPLLFAFERRRALLIVVWQRGIEIDCFEEKANALR